MVSSAYQRLLIFLPAKSISACDSSQATWFPPYFINPTTILHLDRQDFCLLHCLYPGLLSITGLFLCSILSPDPSYTVYTYLFRLHAKDKKKKTTFIYPSLEMEIPIKKGIQNKRGTGIPHMQVIPSMSPQRDLSIPTDWEGDLGQEQPTSWAGWLTEGTYSLLLQAVGGTQFSQHNTVMEVRRLLLFGLVWTTLRERRLLKCLAGSGWETVHIFHYGNLPT